MKLKRIGHELTHHMPFTILGTALGAVMMIIVTRTGMSRDVSVRLFEIAHPAHVLMSAIVTAAMFRLHGGGKWWSTILVGYFGSIGVATVSDCIIPFVGEALVGLPHAHVHLGFVEEWYLVNLLAALGIAIAFVWPKTKLPHAGHVLLSTFASLFHMTMALGTDLDAVTLAVLPVFLFLAVWLPCCTSDIAFPLLFVRDGELPPCEHCRRKGQAAETTPAGAEEPSA